MNLHQFSKTCDINLGDITCGCSVAALNTSFTNFWSTLTGPGALGRRWMLPYYLG
jgi:hypothetical protein